MGLSEAEEDEEEEEENTITGRKKRRTKENKGVGDVRESGQGKEGGGR